MTDNVNRSEAERLLGLAEKLLQSRDFSGCRDFAVLAQESAPLLDGSDQILAICDVLLAADKRINNRPNWYAVLQLDGRSDDLNLLKGQYRRLALLLHPDKNKFPFSHDAFRLVSDAWAVLSDSSKKSVYDKQCFVYSPLDLASMKKQKSQQNRASHQKFPVSQSPATTQKILSNFWTACPYCYSIHQYPRVYLNCCLKCNKCGKAIHAAEIPTLPEIVQGKDAYNCTWGVFPMGFVSGNMRNGSKQAKFPNWMPPMFGNVAPGMAPPNGSAEADFVDVPVAENYQDGNVTPVHENVTPAHENVTSVRKPGSGKRGRPRKNVYNFVNVPLAENNQNVNVTPENVTSVRKPGSGKRGRPRKYVYDFVNVPAAESNQNGNVTPVHENVTSVRKPGTGKRGRPRKNVYNFVNVPVTENNQNGNVTPVHENVVAESNLNGSTTPVHENVVAESNLNGSTTPVHENVVAESNQNGNVTPVHVNVTSVPKPGTRKRGRPRKNV